MDELRFIGVDPGMSGGASLIAQDGQIIDVIAFKKLTDRDISDWFREWGSHHPTAAMLELVHSMPGQGVKSVFSFGRSYGFLESCLVCHHVPYTKVSPVKWQNKMECRTRGDKNVSKSRCQQLYPEQKCTHAISDAILIGAYARRIHLGL